MPSFMAVRPRWKSYASIPYYSAACGIEVYRPAYLVVPWLMQAVWSNEVAYYMLRAGIKELHRKHGFDAILSFDLFNAGGLAWRLGRDLGIPAGGWATGSDIRSRPDSAFGHRVRKTLTNLDLVFYQSSELLNLAAGLLQSNPEHLVSSGRHRVLSRGIIEPEASVSDEKKRPEVRGSLGITEEEVMVLYLGRIIRDKGLFGLIDIFAKNAEQAKRLKLVIVGSQPGFDHSAEFIAHLNRFPVLLDRVHVLPACAPKEIWRYFNAADVFAFPSFREGMPNSLLEAMISGLPSVTFDIPAVRDIVSYDQQAIISVDKFDYEAFFQKLLLLSNDEQLRKVTGARGKKLLKQHFSLVQNMRQAIDRLDALK